MEQRLTRLEETYERGFSRLEETYERGFSRLEEMIAELCERCGLLMRRIDGDEEQYPVMDDETDLLGTRTIVDPKAEIREGLVHKAISEKESIPQFQVPIANAEIVRSIEPGKVDLGLENEEYVVLNENLEQEWDQEVQGMEKICSAHKVFVKMPGKEKRMKHLKAWKFKFKSTSKRSKLMDVKFFYVEEIALLNKDPKETIWNCVKKEFKETLAACGMKRVDQFKLIEEIGSSATNNVQVTEWIHEEESEKERKWKDVKLSGSLQSYYDDQGKSAELVMRDQTEEIRSYVVYSPRVSVQRDGAVETQTCISRRANHVWKPGRFVHLESQLGWLERADSNQEKESNKKLRNVKDGIVKPNLRYSLLAVQRIWKKETHDADIIDAYYVLQEEFEQVENHTPCYVIKLEGPQDHDALLLPFHGDERFQIKHKWRFKLLLSILELELYLDSLVLITSYAHQFDIISLIILMSVELSVSSLQNQMDSSSLQNLEVKVSSKEGDLIQGIGDQLTWKFTSI